MQEYRSMHKQNTRGQLPHNKLLYPESLRYLALWVLGEAIPPLPNPPALVNLKHTKMLPLARLQAAHNLCCFWRCWHTFWLDHSPYSVLNTLHVIAPACWL